jgi:hypothetical protein
LGVADFGLGIDYFLSCFLQLLGQLLKLQDFPFDERIAQCMQDAIDELLVRLVTLEDALAKWVEWGLGAIVGSRL